MTITASAGTAVLPPTATSLREAIDAEPAITSRPPEFSPDGGVTIFTDGGRSVRLQPLGRRTRVSLCVRDRLVAEAEVDQLALLAGIAAGLGVYAAADAALERENGPHRR